MLGEVTRVLPCGCYMIAKVFKVVTKEFLGCWSGCYVVLQDLLDGY